MSSSCFLSAEQVGKEGPRTLHIFILFIYLYFFSPKQAAEAMEAAVTAAVEEQESLHSQIEQLQSKLRHVRAGVRGEGDAVRTAAGSKAHVAAARRQALLKRVPLVARRDVKGVLGKRENAAWLGAVSNEAKGTDSTFVKLDSRGNEEVPVRQGAATKGRPEPAASLAAENERLRKALSECLSGKRTEGEYYRNTEIPRSPGGCIHTQSDVERWESDDEPFGRALRAERSDTVVSGTARRAAISDGGRTTAGGDPAIGNGGDVMRRMLTSARDPGRPHGGTAFGRQGVETDRVPIWERATRKAEMRAQGEAGRGGLQREHSPPQVNILFSRWLLWTFTSLFNNCSSIFRTGNLPRRSFPGLFLSFSFFLSFSPVIEAHGLDVTMPRQRSSHEFPCS
jgi:hypothetical protein